MQRKLTSKQKARITQNLENENIEYIIRNNTTNPKFEGDMTQDNLIKHGIELVEDWDNHEMWIAQFKEPICAPVYLKGKNPNLN